MDKKCRRYRSGGISGFLGEKYDPRMKERKIKNKTFCRRTSVSHYAYNYITEPKACQAFSKNIIRQVHM